jgi:hypothetical protein
MPCPHPVLSIVPEHLLTTIHIDGRPYVSFQFNQKQFSDVLICTMHREENTNNLEVLRLAAYCRLHRIKLTMFGTLNQFPLFSLFADSVILEDVQHSLCAIYDDVDHPHKHTTAIPAILPPSLKVHDLCLKGFIMYGEKPTGVFAQALSEVNDEEVVEHFANATVHVISSSYKTYLRLKQEGFIDECAIICELKEYAFCHGTMFRDMIESRAKETGLSVITNRTRLRQLSTEAGQHYMAVQVLASMLSGWSWVCYGGSSNIFSFFPLRVLLLSDCYVQQDLCAKLSRARFRERGFPMFDANEFFALDDTLVSRIRAFTRQAALCSSADKQI